MGVIGYQIGRKLEKKRKKKWTEGLPLRFSHVGHQYVDQMSPGGVGQCAVDPVLLHHAFAVGPPGENSPDQLRFHKPTNSHNPARRNGAQLGASTCVMGIDRKY